MHKFVSTYSPIGRLLFSRKFFRPLSDLEAMRSTAAVVVASAELYKERFDGEFYTVIWPRRRLAPHLETKFIALLNEGGVRVISPPPLPNHEESMMHPLDEHPSSKEVDWVAKHVLAAIEAVTP